MTAGIGYIFLALAATGQSTQGVPASPSSTLVFEFPDGSRGGYGNIQGTGSMPDLGGPYFALEQIRKCGAPDAKYSDIEISHSRIILAASTDQDREIVSCVKRSVPFHFSVSVFAKDSPGNDFLFREFWSSHLMPADKVK